MTVIFYMEEAEDGSIIYVAEDYDDADIRATGDDWLTCFRNYLEKCLDLVEDKELDPQI